MLIYVWIVKAIIVRLWKSIKYNEHDIHDSPKKKRYLYYTTLNVTGVDIISPTEFFTMHRTVYVPAESPV